MKSNTIRLIRLGGALTVAFTTAFTLTATIQAATSFSNSLTGITGNSTQVPTQSALAAAGFNVFSTAGLDVEFTSDPTVVLDATGARFGYLFGGDGGRNYMRTIDSDYATVDFVAEITVESTLSVQDYFIGMGSGDTALFGVPDWTSLNSSTFVTTVEDSLTTWRSANDANAWLLDGPSVQGAGTHRIRLTFDATARTMTYAMDVNYAGGDFAADATADPVDLNHIDCPTGCGNPERPC